MLLNDCGVVAVLDTRLILVNKNQNTIYSHVCYPLVGKKGIKQIIKLISI